MGASWKKTLFIPGPTDVHPDVLAAMAQPVIGHRSAEMAALHDSMQPRLQLVFDTDRPVYVVTGSATALMDAAIRNLVSASVLCVDGGAFGRRWLDSARACDKQAVALTVPPERGLDAAELDHALSENRFDAVTLVHSETSVGVVSPLDPVIEVMNRHPETLVLVDAVSSLGGMPVKARAFDLVLTASQKCLGMPPGLAYYTLSERALATSAAVKGRGYYVDFGRIHQRHLERGPGTTPAIPLYFAADRQLRRIESEGLAARFARHRACGEIVRREAEGLLTLVAVPERASPAVSAFRLPPGVQSTPVRAALKGASGISIAAGYGALKEQAIRIGHLGECTPEDASRVISAVLDVVGRLAAHG